MVQLVAFWVNGSVEIMFLRVEEQYFMSNKVFSREDVDGDCRRDARLFAVFPSPLVSTTKDPAELLPY